jgi:hypothetical protein
VGYIVHKLYQTVQWLSYKTSALLAMVYTAETDDPIFKQGSVAKQSEVIPLDLFGI